VLNVSSHCILVFLDAQKSSVGAWAGVVDPTQLMRPQKSLGGSRVLVQTRAMKKDLNNGLFKVQLYPKAAAVPCQLHLVV